MNASTLLQTLRDDLRGAIRSLARAPGFHLLAAAMLALGLGLSVSMFSATQGILLSSLPLHQGELIHLLSADNEALGITDAAFTVEEALDLSAGVAGFERIALYWWYSVGVFDGEQARNLTTQMVGPGYFATLAVQPVLGRVPSDDELAANAPVAVISHSQWTRYFGASPAVLGQRLDVIDGAPLTVIGVLPPEIELFAGDTALWQPLPQRALPQGDAARSVRTLMLVGRLAEGVDPARAEAALNARIAALPRSSGESGWQVRAGSLLDQLVGDVRAALWGGFALALLVLLIGASNLALMLDARRSLRQRERAVRLALGATPARLQRARVFELALLSSIALALGLPIAYAAITVFRRLAASSLERAESIQLDPWAFAFAAGLGVVLPALVLAAGALPRAGALAQGLRGAGRGTLGAPGSQRWLPAFAVALATVSLVCAIGLGAGLWRLQRVDPGYRVEDVQVLQIFRIGQDAFVPFAERMLESLAALPGVEQVALASAVPLSNIGGALVEVRTSPAGETSPQQFGMRHVSPAYRSLLQIPLMAGRDFAAEDRRGAQPVAIVSDTGARRLFPGESALGRTVHLPDGRGGWLAHQVVGVIGDVRSGGPRDAPAPEVLVPYAQQPRIGMSFLVRSRAGMVGLDGQMRAALAQLDPRQPITEQFTLSERIAQQLRPARVFSTTVAAFAGLALLLAGAGVYAVASLLQRRRLSEYGLRMALGSRPSQVAVRALGEGLGVALLGVVVGGVIGGAALSLVDLGALGVAAQVPFDALALGAAGMLLVSLLASAAPALRASRIDPIEVLRQD